MGCGASKAEAPAPKAAATPPPQPVRFWRPGSPGWVSPIAHTSPWTLPIDVGGAVSFRHVPCKPHGCRRPWGIARADPRIQNRETAWVRIQRTQPTWYSRCD